MEKFGDLADHLQVILCQDEQEVVGEHAQRTDAEPVGDKRPPIGHRVLIEI